MDNLLHQTTDVSVALGKVEWAKLGRRLVQARVSSEDTTALTLRTNDYMLSVRLRCLFHSCTYRVPWSCLFVVVSKLRRLFASFSSLARAPETESGRSRVKCSFGVRPM